MGAREVYQKTRKVPDLFWNRFVCRPLAAPLVAALERTRITPDQITLAAVPVALAAAALIVFVPGHRGLVAGVVVFQLSYVLDCADGMLARLRGTASRVGHLLDFLMDEIKAFVMLAAVSFRLSVERQSSAFLLLGLGGLVALASGVAFTTFLRRPEVAGEGPMAATAPRRGLGRIVGAVEGVAKFLIHYPSYILYAALAGRIEFYLYPYVAVNALYALRAYAGLLLRFGRFAPRA